MSLRTSPRTRVRPPSQTLPLLLLLAQVGCTPSRTEQDPLEGWHPPPREAMKDPPSEQEPPFVDPYADRDLDGTPDTDDCAAEDATRYRLVDVWHDADADGRTVKDPETLCVGDLLDEGQEWASDEADCDDSDPARYTLLPLYDDSDNDGVGTGTALAVCAGEGATQGFASAGGDCDPADGSRFAELSYQYRDADLDSYTVPKDGTVCAGSGLPSGYYWYESSFEDCDDQNPDAYAANTYYADEDADGVGAGDAHTLCTGWDAPTGYSSTPGDCAPGDAAAYQLLSYYYRDADSDSYFVLQSSSVCAGEYLPPGYAQNASRFDCDDLNATSYSTVRYYLDEDGDGVGAGDVQQACTNGQLPAGTVGKAGDCAPADPSLWQSRSNLYVDRDGDGATTAKTAVLCVGATLSAPYSFKASGNDCDDGDAGLTRYMALYPDEDGDGLGAWPYEVLCIGKDIPAGYSKYGDDANDHDPGIGADDERT